MMAAQNQYNILITNNWFPIFSIKTINRVRVMEFNATYNNISGISWWLVLLVEKIGVTGEKHRSAAID
jgi:hypothetical protein